MDQSHRDTLEQIYAGAREAGVDISGLLSERSVHSDEFTASDRLELTVHLDPEGRPSPMAFGPSFRISVFKDGLEWRADVSRGDTHVSTTARSASEVTRDALLGLGLTSNLEDPFGGPLPPPLHEGQDDLAGLEPDLGTSTPTGDAAAPDDSSEPEVPPTQEDGDVDFGKFEPEISIYRRRDEFEAMGGDAEVDQGVTSEQEEATQETGLPNYDGFEPDIAIYQRREEEPYRGSDVEPVERDPVSRSVPDPGAGDDDGSRARRVRRVDPEPAFDKPKQRRLNDDDDSMLMRLVKIGVPLLIAIMLVILGINVFGDETPNPLSGPLETDQDAGDPAPGQGEDSTSSEDNADPPSEEDLQTDPGPAEEPPTVQPLSEILRGSFGGNLAFEPQGDGAPFDSDFLLSILDEASVAAVFPPEKRQLAEQIAADMGDEVAFDAVALGVILSQDQPSGVSQNTYGVIGDRGDDYVAIVTGNKADSHTEGYWLMVMPCDGFPVDCDTVLVSGFSFGGPPGLDLELGLSDSALANGDFQPSQEYGWLFRVAGTLIRESGQGS